MKENRDFAFEMRSRLEARIGQCLTVYLEGGTKLQNYTVVTANPDVIVLVSHRDKTTSTVLTTADRVIAIEETVTDVSADQTE